MIVKDHSASFSSPDEIQIVCGVKILPDKDLKRIISLERIDQLIDEVAGQMPSAVQKISREIREREEQKKGLEHFSPTSPTILLITEEIGKWKVKREALQGYYKKLLDRYNEIERLEKTQKKLAS